MKEKNLFVFVKLELFLHEDGFTKLRELLSSSAEKLKSYSIISLPVDDEDNLTVVAFSGDIMNSNAIELQLQEGYVFLTVENLKILLSLKE